MVFVETFGAISVFADFTTDAVIFGKGFEPDFDKLAEKGLARLGISGSVGCGLWKFSLWIVT